MPDAVPLNPAFLIESEADLRDVFGPASPTAIEKCQDRLDPHSRTWIARSPFLCLGTQSPDGGADVTPRGDPPGFVKELDEKTLLIPERPGNRRLDSLSNILTNPAVGLIFMIPGFEETLRINGRAGITCDPDLLDLMAVNDRPPKVAIVVTIDELYLHCAKAFRRSDLWSRDALQDRSEMPSLKKMILDQNDEAPEDAEEMAKIDAALEDSYRKTMY